MAEDVGIKVSQEGKDVEGGDQDLLFSSSWPNLKIIFNGRVTANTQEVVEAGVRSGVVMKHNLGFVPFFLAYGVQEPSDFGSYSNKDEFRLQMNLPISADKTNIYVSVPIGDPQVVSFDLGLIIFDLDIEENYKSPSINTGTSSSTRGNGNIGVKLSKEGKDISSKDLRDFILHSGTRSPMVHAVVNDYPKAGVGGGSGYGFLYTNDLPYNPMFFLFAQHVTQSTLAPRGAYALLTSPFPIIATNKEIMLENWTANEKVSIVVLKDPFIVDDNIQKAVL